MRCVRITFFVFCCFVTGAFGQAPAAGDGLLLSIAMGFLIKVVLVVLGGMVKLLILGFTSLGTSGLALFLGLLFLKSTGLAVPPWPGHRLDRITPNWHPVWLRPPRSRHPERNAKQLELSSILYKSVDGKKRNGPYPVPVAVAVNSRAMPLYQFRDHGNESVNATSQKRISKHMQTHTLAN